MPITYCRNGQDWALRIPAEETIGLRKGSRVLVTKKNGSTKEETLGTAINIQKTFTIALIEHDRTDRRRVQTRSNNAPGGRRCSYCGARDCPRAWNPHELCQDD